ncbi:MAG: type II toxin-antitoxin system VapC family toxin [Gemmataceae bacterium]|nr:type II toxin-antitoxin system VapC family toxin [Gemmataceae bacterium]
MTHLLDSNACVHLLRQRGHPLVRRRFRQHPPGALVLCSVVVGELYYGAERSNDPVGERAKTDAFVARFVSLDVDDRAAREYARVRADLQARGLPIGDNDTFIAAVALVHRLKLVTHNTAQFSRVHGLDIEDWEIP